MLCVESLDALKQRMRFDDLLSRHACHRTVLVVLWLLILTVIHLNVLLLAHLIDDLVGE